MSTVGAGAATSAYEQLSSLVDFLKSPASQDRVKELRDLEASSKKAADDASKVSAEADAKSKALAESQNAHRADVIKFNANQAAHNARVAKIQTAITALQNAISGD
jgi:hypothetical protein